jgi:hypothetical protein
MNDEKLGLIYEVQITKENIKELLYKEMCRVAIAYGHNPQELITAIVLPPSAFKIMEVLCQKECRRVEFSPRKDTLSFQGIPLLCGATPYIISTYSLRYWHCAHQDSKRMVSEIGGVDA